MHRISIDVPTTQLRRPVPSPELPISVHLDGNLGAVDFIKRLHAGGLQLRSAADGAAVIVLAERDPFADAPLTGPGSRLESQLAEIRAAVPLRRCRDCQLDLGTRPGDTLRAAFACPRFGQPRVGVESRCNAFVAKAAP